MTSDTRTKAERRYDAVALSRPRTPTPTSAPAVEVEVWQSDDGVTYHDVAIGQGLSRVTIGARAPHESGIELLIGGCAINERVQDVLTIADVRQLRDNLTALLNDACSLPPVPTMPSTTDERAWKAPLGAIDGCAVVGTYIERELVCVDTTWQGLPIGVYDGYLNIQAGEGLDFHGDMHFSEWRIIQQLAGRDVIERLQALFKHCKVARVAAA